MKNPFPQPPYVAYSNAGTLLVQRSGADITDEQKLFVLHAINQHEKLVKMLRTLEWCSRDGVSGDTDCPICGGCPVDAHAPSCKLATLLDED